MTIEDVHIRLGGATVGVDHIVPAEVPRQPVGDETATHPDGRGLRVLVVGINYGPEHTGIAPYTTQLCEYLEAQGSSVTVFTGTPHYPSWTVDPSMRWRLRRVERRERFELRRLRHYVPRKQTALRRALYELTFALQVAIQRPKERPDVVLAVVPSLLSAVAAQRIAQRAGVPLVVWVQDLMGRAASQSGIEGGARVAGLVGSVEKWLLQRANHILVLNTHFQNYVKSLEISIDRISLRPNWSHVAAPSGADRDETRARLGWRANETVLLHTGNMGLKQGLENVVDSARLASKQADEEIRFVLMGDGSQRQAIQERAAGVPTIQILPPASNSEYSDILAAADILLVNERPSSVDMSLPSKLTSYYLAGRPIIAASATSGATATELERSGSGVVVPPGDPVALIHAARNLACDRETMNCMGDIGRLYANDNLSAKQALPLLTNILRATVACAHISKNRPKLTRLKPT